MFLTRPPIGLGESALRSRPPLQKATYLLKVQAGWQGKRVQVEVGMDEGPRVEGHQIGSHHY